MSSHISPSGSGAESFPERSPKSRPVRVLVADDDADIRRAVSDILSSAGYAVDAAEDGSLAWDTLQRNAYDILITDNNMPKVSGVELLNKLRTAQMKLPVIMITSIVPQHEFANKPWLMPDATVLKPFGTAELLGKIGILLGGRSKSRIEAELFVQAPTDRRF